MSTNFPRQFALLVSAMGLACGTLVAQPTPITVPGFLKFEVYTNLPGAAVSDLVFAPEFPDSPGRVFYMTAFDTRLVYRDDSHENFGGRISGVVTPTESGNYQFFLRSDDASQLFLSPDADPANLELIAEDTTVGGPFEETGAPETSAPRTLEAGQSYAIEVLYKEGNGVDFAQVAWRKVEDPTPAAQLLPIPSAFLSALIPPRGSVAITRQPTGGTAGQNEFINLSVDFTATHGPVVVQWQRNGVNVPGLIGGTVNLGPLTAADEGSYRAVVSIPGATMNSTAVTVTVTPDITPPTIKSVVASDTLDMLTVEFSEAVTDASGDEFNYMLDGDVTITSAMILSPTRARLGTSALAIGGTYTLTVLNIMDMAGNTSTQDTSLTFSLDRTAGGAKFEAWLNLGGNAVADLLNHPAYPATPDIAAYVTEFSSREIFADANSMDNYGGRISGWIVPSETAEYEFFVRSDDNSELSLSTDDNPANAVVIASEAACCGPFEEPGAPETSAPQMLMAGNRYYVQVLWKEGGGGDYCDVAWRKVGTPGPAFSLPYISGDVLEAFAPAGTFTAPTVAITSPANGAAFETTDAITLIAVASASAPKSLVKVEFFEQGRVIGTVTNTPYSLTLYELPEGNHTFIARATDSAGRIQDSAPITNSVGTPVVNITLTAINDEFTWRYDRSAADLGTDWRQPGYDDSAWPEGKMLIADEGTTTVEPIRTRISRFNDLGAYVQTFYFRTHFNFTSAVSPDVKLKLRHVMDDGIAVYLNGAEVHRFGLGTGDITYLTDAGGHENIYEGPYDIGITNLVEGDNVLAAEVHQAGTSSSDMVFGLELIATVPLPPSTILNVTRNGALVSISWSPAGGTLESAPGVTGPWTTVANATNPHMATANEGAQFFRVSK